MRPSTVYSIKGLRRTAQPLDLQAGQSRLELTWIAKENRPPHDPRFLLEIPSCSRRKANALFPRSLRPAFVGNALSNGQRQSTRAVHCQGADRLSTVGRFPVRRMLHKNVVVGELVGRLGEVKCAHEDRRHSGQRKGQRQQIANSIFCFDSANPSSSLGAEVCIRLTMHQPGAALCGWITPVVMFKSWRRVAKPRQDLREGQPLSK
jgi:hypothetical protein